MERIMKISVLILFPTQCTIHNLNVSVQYHHLQIFLNPQVPRFNFSGIQIMSETIHRQVLSGNSGEKFKYLSERFHSVGEPRYIFVDRTD